MLYFAFVRSFLDNHYTRAGKMPPDCLILLLITDIAGKLGLAGGFFATFKCGIFGKYV